MKIQIVKFKDGSYAARRINWLNLIVPAFSIYEYLLLVPNSGYSTEYSTSSYWCSHSPNDQSHYQSSHSTVKACVEMYLESLEKKVQEKAAIKLRRKDKGEVVN